MTLKLNRTSRNLVVRPITLLAYYPLGWNVLTIFGKELGEGVILEATTHSSEIVGDVHGPTRPVVLESQAKGAASISPRHCFPSAPQLIIS